MLVNDEEIDDRFCPNLTESHGKISNSYTSYSKRTSYLITIALCENNNCASSSQIDYLFSQLTFTLLMVEGKAELSNKETYNKSPIKYSDKLVSQF